MYKTLNLMIANGLNFLKVNNVQENTISKLDNTNVKREILFASKYNLNRWQYTYVPLFFDIALTFLNKSITFVKVIITCTILIILGIMDIYVIFKKHNELAVLYLLGGGGV